jgi:glycosyltransferase involved in cell wall biosynthesis
MKFLHWIRSIAGGAGVFVVDLCISLREMGIECYIAETDANYSKIWGTQRRSIELRQSISNWLFEIDEKEKINELIQELNPDYIFYHLWSSMDAKRWSYKDKRTHIAWIHTSILNNLKGYDKYLFVSFSQLKDNSLCDIKNKFVIKNGINILKINNIAAKSSSGRFRICRVSGLSKEKISGSFLRILTFIKDLDCEFIIIGEGEGKKMIDVFLRKNQIKNVYLLGDLGFKEIIGYYKSSDVILYMTGEHEENHSIALLEGQACGLPVICENKGGLAEQIIHLKTGIICNNNSQITYAISLLMKERVFLKSLSENSIKHSALFEINKTAEELLMIL